MATINIVGDLVLDQSAGVQTGADGDDVAISVDAITGDISGGLDAAFLAYLNGLTLSSTQLAFADTAEAASQVGLVTVTPAVGENVVELEFAPLTNASSGLFTVDGDAISLTTVQGGSAVEAWAGGQLVAAFYIIPDATNTSATVQMITFEAIDHPNPDNPDDTVDFSDILKVRALVETSTPIGDHINVDDDGPSISAATDDVNLVVDETILLTNAFADFSTQFTKDGGTDGEASTVHTLSITGGNGTDSGLVDTVSDLAVLLFNNNGVIEGRTVDASGTLVFTVTTTAAGVVTLDQDRAVVHDPNLGPNDTETLTADNLIVLTATITDGDGDTASADLNIGQNLIFTDDAPIITVPFDGDRNPATNPVPPGPATRESVGNAVGAQASGDFGWDIGNDKFGVYDGTHSDFVDVDGNPANGIQIGLSGNVTGLQPAALDFTSASATLVAGSETDHTATFNWIANYDSDPSTVAIDPGSVGGTLVFNKDLDTYTITVTNAADGFTRDILHTSELLSKEPTSNVGHPNIVVEKLQADDATTPADEDFFVQFTANSNPNGNPFGFNTTGDGSPIAGDTGFDAGDQVTSNFEDWVSATQATNGVAGDTIQKGELLTLRFFKDSPGIINDNGANNVPSQTANDMVIKFDGIGNSEDLMLILNLVNLGANGVLGGGDDTFTTKAMYVSNANIFKTGQVPAAYGPPDGFTLDNNDGLVIVEKNDYNTAISNWVLQGAQIMQSGNGLTGTAIDLNRATGTTGASTGTHAFDATDNDVLKITDLGFTATQTTTPDAHLNFAVDIHDADGDSTGINHIFVDVV
ncbi:DUF5801 repeats-in-toxin domain-containing protein [Mesorhizobium calcicola]|uniref:DUF5801 repeats-in-toxin domain-containing protein n=1 Tax=Mesorhizobium calcicola TaxID=1300310 RepID=A0ABW4WDR3_9HYPH